MLERFRDLCVLLPMMKQILFLIGLLLFVISSCARKNIHSIGNEVSYDTLNTDSIAENTPIDTLMEQTTDAIVLRGLIESTSSYCGGAAPPQDLLDRLETPQAFVNGQLVFIEKSSKKAYPFKTDATGHYSISLLPGTYELHPEKRTNIEDYSYDPNCKAWLSTVFAEVIVKEKPGAQTNDCVIHFVCDPCDPYIHMRP